MADLVADDRSDGAEVHRVVRLCVEERGLEDRGGEHDLVLRGVVVGVDRLRGHVPLVAVDGTPELTPLAVGRVGVGGAHVIDEGGAGVQVQRGVVAPLGGVSDLRVEGRQLGQRLLLRLLAHPVQAADRLAVGVEQAAHECVHRVLGLGREVAGDPGPSHGLAQVGLDEGQCALPSGAQLLRARQCAAVEVEVLRDEVGGEQGCAGVDGRGAQPLLERRQVGALPQGGSAAQVVGLIDVDDEAGDGHVGSARPRVPVKAGGEGVQMAPGGRVVGQQGVAVGDRVAVVGGQRRLEGHDAPCRAIGVGHARQRQKTPGVGNVSLTDRLVVFLSVVGLVGQPDAGLDQADHVGG